MMTFVINQGPGTTPGVEESGGDPAGLQRRQTPVNFEGTDSDGEEAVKASCLVVQSMASGHQAHDRLGSECQEALHAQRGSGCGPWSRGAIVGSRTACLGLLLWTGTLTGTPRHDVGSSPTHPLLPVTVLKVIDSAVIPVQPDAHQVAGQETIFCQDHEVGEEATQSLDHSWEEERGRWGEARDCPVHLSGPGDSHQEKGGPSPSSCWNITQASRRQPEGITWW